MKYSSRRSFALTLVAVNLATLPAAAASLYDFAFEPDPAFVTGSNVPVRDFSARGIFEIDAAPGEEVSVQEGNPLLDVGIEFELEVTVKVASSEASGESTTVTTLFSSDNSFFGFFGSVSDDGSEVVLSEFSVLLVDAPTDFSISGFSPAASYNNLATGTTPDPLVVSLGFPSFEERDAAITFAAVADTPTTAIPEPSKTVGLLVAGLLAAGLKFGRHRSRNL